MLRKAILVIGVFISLSLLWFAVYNYRQAAPLAEENLRGLALSVTAAIDNIAVRDPSLASLAKFHTADIAYFALADRKGLYLFHSNQDLIGTPVLDDPFLSQLGATTPSEARVTLGTGESGFQYIAPIYIPGRTLVLRLLLHTYRADAVIRRAKVDSTVLLGLLAAVWLLGAGVMRYARREEQHQMEMARRENLARLGEMGAVLAHEIRNPLGGIKGFAQLIAKKPTAERNAGFAASIVTEAVRLEDLVSDLLAYAVSETRPPSVFNLCEVVEDTVSLLSVEAHEAGVEIVHHCPAALSVSGYRDHLEQVLLNLGKNALQAMPNGGGLSIAVEATGNRISITVQDSGQGVAEQDLAKVFDPFFTTKTRGSGLGLALCKKVVEEHQGTIEMTSKLNEGTTVKIIIPLAKRGEIPGGRQ